LLALKLTCGRLARWTFLAHASSKHSPEHHPSSALIDATVSHARQRKLVWSAATNPEEITVLCQHDIQHTRLFEVRTSQ
jgi:hypothetical protein